MSIITVNLSDAILDSKVGALDRSLGFLFGVARGFLLCVIGYVFFSMLDPPDHQYAWIREAKTRPLLESVGKDITSMVPEMTALVPRDFMNKFTKQKPEGRRRHARQGGRGQPRPGFARRRFPGASAATQRRRWRRRWKRTMNRVRRTNLLVAKGRIGII